MVIYKSNINTLEVKIWGSLGSSQLRLYSKILCKNSQTCTYCKLTGIWLKKMKMHIYWNNASYLKSDFWCFPLLLSFYFSIFLISNSHSSVHQPEFQPLVLMQWSEFQDLDLLANRLFLAFYLWVHNIIANPIDISMNIITGWNLSSSN